MLRILKTKLAAILVLSLVLVGVAAPAASAQNKSDVCAGVGVVTGSANCGAPSGNNTTVNSIIATVINIISFIVGVVAVVMIMIGGFKYITSSGDSSNIQSAKNTILYAIVGLVIVATAQIIVRFVLNNTLPT